MKKLASLMDEAIADLEAVGRPEREARSIRDRVLAAARKYGVAVRLCSQAEDTGRHVEFATKNYEHALRELENACLDLVPDAGGELALELAADDAAAAEEE